MKKAIFPLLLTFLAADVNAASRWVSDTLYISLRSAKGNDASIISSGIKTGTELTLLEEDPQTGWSRVQTASGEEGWVRSQFLLSEPTSNLRFQDNLSQMQTLRDDRAELQKTVDALQAENSMLKEELQRDPNQAAVVSTDGISRNEPSMLDLNKRHQELMKQHQLLQTEVDVLKAENSRLAADNRNTFFLYGAGAVLLGVIIALLVPLLRRRKRYSEWA